jgi:hypothetical protein
MRRIALTAAILGVALCAVPSAAIAEGGAGLVHPKASATTTASAARVFLNIREAKRIGRRAVREHAAENGDTSKFVNVYRCRRHSRVRVHCRFFEKGTFFNAQNQQLGYSCSGQIRVRETADAYHVRARGIRCFEYPLG